MKHRTLGDSDLSVSEIALGSWLTYAGGVDLERARACTVAALDEGITLLDTAESYGDGAAESAWGEILRPYPRDSYVLATKVWGPKAPPEQGLTPAYLHQAVEASLRRLQTDHLDLYLVHRFDPDLPVEDLVETLVDLVDAGQVRYLGFSEWTPEQITAAVELAGPGRFVVSQPQYSMLWRAPEAEVFDLSSSLGISQVVWSPLAQGLLTGKYRPGVPYPPDTRFGDSAMNGAIGLVANDESIAAVQGLTPIAEEDGVSMAQLALAWVLRRTEVAAALTGASRPEQVRGNAAASGVSLSGDVLAAIDEALGDVPVTEAMLAAYTRAGVRHRGDATAG